MKLNILYNTDTERRCIQPPKQNLILHAILYAIWGANRYTITYNTNVGSGNIDTQTKLHDVNITVRFDEPMRDGYIFKGWSTSANNVVEYRSGEVFSLNENIVLYAVWEPIDTSRIIATGVCGDNLSWTLTKNGTLIISGTGSMHDWDYNTNRPTWDEYITQGSIKRVYIEDGVVNIGNYAF